MYRLLILLALVAGCSADGGIAWRGPPPVKEVFYYNSRSYFLYSEKVGWDEASAICQSNKGFLATAEDAGKAAFLAQSIGDAWAPLEDMWIGGQLTQNTWQWVGIPASSSKKNFPETMRQVDNSSFLYPPWVDGAMPYRKGKDCLAIDRNGHSDPYFVDLDCKLPRPFICELATEKKDGGPVLGKVVEILDYEFILYHARVNWESAVAYCRSEGFVLATILNNTYADKLAKAMLKSRPEFEDVWIGGSYHNEKWSWVENSLEIPLDPIPNGPKGAIFPPWAHNPPKSDNDYCTLFDRHLCDTPKFIDVKCSRLRDFVCAKAVTGTSPQTDNRNRVIVRQKEYIVHHNPASFSEAVTMCEDEKNEGGKGKLLFIDGGVVNDPFDELANIMGVMSNHKDEIIHVWLGAKYDMESKSFKWLYDSPNFQKKTRADNQRILPLETNEVTGYPPWCNNDEPTPEMACLNLDRQNYNTPLFYGLECNATQPFICVVEAKPKGVERFHVKQRSYQTSDPKLTKAPPQNHLEASRACEMDTGHMIGEVDDEELAAVTLNLPDGSYYFGARYAKARGSQKYVLTWPTIRKPVSLKSVEIDPYTTGNQCSVLRVANAKANRITSINCDTKTSYPFICSDKCGGMIDEVVDRSWRCSWQEGSSVTETMLDKVCEKRCPVNKVLIGTKKMTCSLEGWVGSRNSKPPKCADPDEAAAEIKSLLSNLSTPAGTPGNVLYIYDGSNDVTKDDLDVMKYIVGGSITNIRPSSASRKRRFSNGRWWKARSRRDNSLFHVPIVSLSSESKKPSHLVSKDVCDVVGNLDTVAFNQTGGRRDYSKAFSEAARILQEMQPYPFTVVLMSGGPNQGEDFKESLRALKQVAKSVVSIGVGQKFNTEELVDIATADVSHRLNHLGVADISVFKKVGDFLPKPDTCNSQINSLKSKAEQAVIRIQETKYAGGEQPTPPEQYYTEPTDSSAGPGYTDDSWNGGTDGDNGRENGLDSNTTLITDADPGGNTTSSDVHNALDHTSEESAFNDGVDDASNSSTNNALPSTSSDSTDPGAPPSTSHDSNDPGALSSTSSDSNDPGALASGITDKTDTGELPSESPDLNVTSDALSSASPDSNDPDALASEMTVKIDTGELPSESPDLNVTSDALSSESTDSAETNTSPETV